MSIQLTLYQRMLVEKEAEEQLSKAQAAKAAKSGKKAGSNSKKKAPSAAKIEQALKNSSFANLETLKDIFTGCPAEEKENDGKDVVFNVVVDGVVKEGELGVPAILPIKKERMMMKTTILAFFDRLMIGERDLKMSDKAYLSRNVKGKGRVDSRYRPTEKVIEEVSG